MNQLDRLRRNAALAVGPFGLTSVALFVIAVAGNAGDDVAMMRSPVMMAASVAGLACLNALSVCALLPAEGGRGPLGTLAFVGTVLAAGGEWALLFVTPALAVEAPHLAVEGHPLVLAGYVVSFITMALGWVYVAVQGRRSGWLTRGGAIAYGVGALLLVAPLPSRFAILAVIVSVVEVRRARAAVPQPA
jgi:hypothetical protein